MKTSRQYVMRARAEATEQTRLRIVRAAVDLCRDTMSFDFGLADVAAQAGVSVQTLLRHFGSREGLLAAGQRLAEAEVTREREARAGDVAAAVRVICGHYERVGDWSLAMLAQAGRDERAREVTERGRSVHREWVTTVFAPQLAAAPGGPGALTDLLVVATDVYTWKLLRRDRKLSRAQVEDRLVRMINAIAGGGS
ncbi:MAG TPA: TetR/AcrR family transcriptional regulator [Streptosporangiaceae bacterium]